MKHHRNGVYEENSPLVPASRCRSPAPGPLAARFPGGGSGPPGAGDYLPFCAGEPVEALPCWEMVRRGVIYVPEGMRVFPGMTVLENLEVGAYLVRRQLKARLDQACQIFPELKDRLRAPAGVLSGGQPRMVTLARGIMSAPRLLMLDEPFMGLSPTSWCKGFATPSGT